MYSIAGQRGELSQSTKLIQISLHRLYLGKCVIVCICLKGMIKPSATSFVLWSKQNVSRHDNLQVSDWTRYVHDK